MIDYLVITPRLTPPEGGRKSALFDSLKAQNESLRGLYFGLNPNSEKSYKGFMIPFWESKNQF